MSLAILEESGVDVSRLARSQKSGMEYLMLLRSESDTNAVMDKSNSDIDVLAMNYLLMPKFEQSSLVIAMLLRNGMSGRLVKILSNVIPKEMVAKILGISMTNLSQQYKRKSLDKSQTEAVVGFLKVWSQLMSLFKNNNDVVVDWLSKKKGPLCDIAPIDLLDTASGREAVLDMIYRIRTGDFS